MASLVTVRFSGLIVLFIEDDGSGQPASSRRVEPLIVDTSRHGDMHHEGMQRHYPRVAFPVSAAFDKVLPDAIQVDSEGRQFAELGLEGKDLSIVPNFTDTGIFEEHQLEWVAAEAEEPGNELQKRALNWVLDLRRLGMDSFNFSGVHSKVSILPGTWSAGQLAMSQDAIDAEPFVIIDRDNQKIARQVLAEQFVWTAEVDRFLTVRVGDQEFRLSAEGLTISVANLPNVGVINDEAEDEVTHAQMYGTVGFENAISNRVRVLNGGVTISTRWCPAGRWVG